MADKPEKPVIDTPGVLDEISRNTSSSRHGSRHTSRPAVRRSGLLWFIVLGLALGLGWLAYEQWQFRLEMAELQQENRQLETALHESAEQLAAAGTQTRNHLAQLEQLFSVDDDTLEQIQQQFNRELARFDEYLARSTERLQEQLSRDTSQLNSALSSFQRQFVASQDRDARWVYAETEYLLRLASRKLQLESLPSMLMSRRRVEKVLQQAIMTAELNQVTLLSTRPAGQSQSLIAAVEARGGRVCELPLIEIAPLSDPQAIAKLKSSILNLDHYQIAIFVSTNAAKLGMEWIDRYWPQLPEGLSAYAVGSGTGEMLRELPWPVHYPESGVTSEDLLAMPGLQHVKDSRIALFRGQGGRELLAGTLRERGAQIDYIELYQRRSPGYSSQFVIDLLHKESVTVILLSSAQGLNEFLKLMEGSDVLQLLPVIVPSERLVELALQGGFSRAVCAGGVDEKAVVDCLLREFS